MDKELDKDIYNWQLYLQYGMLSQQKVLHTRLLKLSANTIHSSSIGIGRISLESGHHQKGLLQLKKAIIINPDSYLAQVDSATALFKLGKENEAFSNLQKALSLDPYSVLGHKAVIMRFQEQERLKDLESFYQEVANQVVNTKFNADLYSGCGQALTGLNEYSKAFEMFQRAFETGQMSFQSHFDSAVALYRKGLFEEAIVQFELAREKDPGNQLVINNIAYMNYCLGKLQKAFEEFDYIIENGLLTARTYSDFILVLFHMDKGEEVINRYRDLLQQQHTRIDLLPLTYIEALRITRVILERDDIDEETREFNTKKIDALNLVLYFIN